MALETTQLGRKFRYNSVDLPDPGAQYTPDEVRGFYAATFPEIVNATVEGPEKQGDALVYTFRRAVGTKGATADTRAHLEAIVAGKVATPAGANVVTPDHVKRNADTFRQWHSLASNGQGEALHAPAAGLDPLP